MDRTEAQLREKLLEAEFTPENVELAIAYVKSFGYIDDERYVRNYIISRQEQKSRRQITQELQFRKGVQSELICKVYEELEPADEKKMIRRQLEKKHYDPLEADDRQRQKMLASLARKGFRTSDILSVMRELEEKI
jgi:regulatory protein